MANQYFESFFKFLNTYISELESENSLNKTLNNFSIELVNEVFNEFQNDFYHFANLPKESSTYDLDISSLLENLQNHKLTFTNHKIKNLDFSKILKLLDALIFGSVMIEKEEEALIETFFENFQERFGYLDIILNDNQFKPIKPFFNELIKGSINFEAFFKSISNVNMKVLLTIDVIAFLIYLIDLAQFIVHNKFSQEYLPFNIQLKFPAFFDFPENIFTDRISYAIFISVTNDKRFYESNNSYGYLFSKMKHDGYIKKNATIESYINFIFERYAYKVSRPKSLDQIKSKEFEIIYESKLSDNFEAGLYFI